MLGGNPPANCFGTQHVTKMHSAFKRLYDKVFQSDGSLGNYLRKQIKDRFGFDNVQEAFIFLPVNLGGLGVQNPFTKLAERDGGVVERPELIMTNFFKEEEKRIGELKLHTLRDHHSNQETRMIDLHIQASFYRSTITSSFGSRPVSNWSKHTKPSSLTRKLRKSQHRRG